MCHHRLGYIIGIYQTAGLEGFTLDRFRWPGSVLFASSHARCGAIIVAVDVEHVGTRPVCSLLLNA